ncbi:MAG: flagellar hook-basal body complex protein FliE [bacterium]|nr:flagellar hook-basal body complex protein FliE [bacterium]
MAEIGGAGQTPGKFQIQRPVVNKPGQPKIDHTSAKYETFSETLNSFVEDVNDLQQDAGKTVDRFVTGEIKDVHDVMIAVEKASVSFELMMEVRNKMIEAYHEMFRMQV